MNEDPNIIDDTKIISKFIQMGQHGLVQVPARFRKKKNGILLGGHWCGAGHKVSDDKVSGYGLRDVENLVVGV